MKSLRLPHLSCQKCNYQWIPRRERPPRVCPKCKCAKWQNYRKP